MTFSRAASIREYLSGASSDGQFQDAPNLSIGNFRSSVDAQSLAIHISRPLKGVKIQLASGANPAGRGVLSSSDGISLVWQPLGSSIPGPRSYFTLGDTEAQIVEGIDPAQFLRVQGSPPFPIDYSFVTLSVLLENLFGLNNVPDVDAAAGITQYRATVLRNESQGDVASFARWLGDAPGVAIGLDPAGVQSFGQGITVIPNETTAPAGVVWNTGTTSGTGLSVTRLAPGQQIGFWIRRVISPGAGYAAHVYNNYHTDYIAY